MVIKRFVVCQTKSDGNREIFQKLLFVLGIGCKGIDILVEIARSGREIVFAPVGAENRCAVSREAEDALDFALHHPLFFRLDIVADGIGLSFNVVFFAIAEAVDREVGLQAIATRKFVDTAYVPTEALKTHLVVSTTSDV